MAHELVYNEEKAIYPMAFTGETPWHGLGQQLPENAPMEVWAKKAGMDFEILSSPISFRKENSATNRTLFPYPQRVALYRNDNGTPLSLVSDRYKIVQPSEILNFFNNLIQEAGFKMNTAGVLFGGKRFWALVEIGKEATLAGKDLVKGFLLLATSCDGSLATTASFTSIRVVCNNTLEFSVDALKKGDNFVKVPHSKIFRPEDIQEKLGLAQNSFDTFITKANKMANHRIDDKDAIKWLVRVFEACDDNGNLLPEKDISKQKANNIKKCFDLYKGKGKGSELKSAKGTTWGLMNSVTEYADFHKNSQTPDNKLNNTWFGSGRMLKNKAYQEAVVLSETNTDKTMKMVNLPEEKNTDGGSLIDWILEG